MKTTTIKFLDIYSVSLDKNKLLKVKSDDFHINNFLHFPVLIQNNGSLWKYGNLYLLSKLKSYAPICTGTLQAIASDLKQFYEFCDAHNIDYLKANKKLLRPTYLYREYLEEKFKNKEITDNTLKRRISTIIGFYNYLTDIENIKFKFELWEKGTANISYENNNGETKYKEVATYDITKVHKQSKMSSVDDCIIDGGKLRPLNINEQKEILNALNKINNIEMLYGFLIALTTGARMQTIFTLRFKHFSKKLHESDNEMRIKIGNGTSCDTKNGKNYVLFIPTWLYSQIQQIYLKSERYLKRRNKSKHIFDSHEDQYIFLTNRGTPYYVAKDDKYRALYKHPSNGATVREFIGGKLQKELLKANANVKFHFHDLRATFGMNLYDNLIQEIDKKKDITTDTAYILHHIRERMGHSSIRTTEQYLNFKTKRKFKKQIQNDFEQFMQGLING